MKGWIAAAALAVCAAPAAAGPPQVHALTGVRIVTAPGQVVESGTVVLRDGVIEAAGAAVEPPADARLWDREGLTVYAGLIEPYSVRALPEAGDGEPPQAGHPSALVRPETDVTAWAAKADSFRKLREAGFTTAVVAPAGGLFRGRGVLMNLGDGPAGDNLLRRDVAQYASFDSAAFQGGYPSSLMGAVALFRQALLDAAWYQTAQAAWSANPAQPRPAQSTALAALAGVAAGRQPLVIESGDLLGSLRIAGLANELSLDVWLVGNGEEYQTLEPIAAAGLPHLLPVAFPKEPKAPEPDDLQTGLSELRHWDEAPANPARLIGAGVRVALTAHGLPEPKQLHPNLARAIEAGLTAEQALAALTTVPAAMLGIADRAGTVEPGKMANLVVVDGELFTKDAKLREVWIDGRRFELKESKPPEVEPAGTWELVVEAGEGQRIPITLTLAGAAPSLTGSVSAQGQVIELASAEVSGAEVEVSFDGAGFGMPGTISFTLEIAGDTAEGSGMSPSGPFTLSGTRTATPEDAS